MEPESFVDMLVRRLRPVHIVEGSTFRFGRARRGTPEMLAALGAEHGFGVRIIEPVRLQDDDGPVPITSSLIRGLVGDGKVRRAALCLGRNYTIRGTVVAGARRGAELGFPTANLQAIDQLIPADGVYAGSAVVAGGRCLAAISVGTNPTFQGVDRKVEAHFLDVDKTLTGEPIDLEFGNWLRAQRKFDSVASLRGQIEADVAAVRAWNNHAGQES